jgi:hypothetical protein
MKRPAVVMLLCLMLGFVAGAWAERWAVEQHRATAQGAGDL